MTWRMANRRWASGRYPWRQIRGCLELRTWGKTSAIARVPGAENVGKDKCDCRQPHSATYINSARIGDSL